MMNVALQVALYGFVVAALPAVTASVGRAEDVADRRKLAQSVCRVEEIEDGGAASATR